jgi:hypothetical protein
MGISRQRVAHLLVEAAMRVADLNEQRHDLERPVASPRAARLRELEEVPPDWLRNSIGVCPRRTKSDSGTILAWRRSTLAIDDYRVAHGYHSRTDAIGEPPSLPTSPRIRMMLSACPTFGARPGGRRAMAVPRPRGAVARCARRS